MPTIWANSAFAGAGDVFETLHSGLTVKLVATPRDELKTCKKTELVSEVFANSDDFDFIPVLDGPSNQLQFVGLFPAADLRKRGIAEGSVSSFYLPIAEEYLIGADASILDFVLQADSHPCQLVVSGAQIVGLVTLSDLQRLPVRAALFALITGFEMSMTDFIKAALPHEKAWMALLKSTRVEKIQQQIARADAKDAFVDALLYTQFCDKAEILKQSVSVDMSNLAFERLLRDFEALRNNLAHANEYAASPDEAKHVCSLVRELVKMRREIRAKSSSSAVRGRPEMARSATSSGQLLRDLSDGGTAATRRALD
jgi:hypothetical protein